MIWVRKLTVFVLSLVLLIALIGGAASVSTKLNLTHPDKLETWLSQSHVYTSIVDNTLHDAQQNASNDAGAGRVSLNDPEVAQAVKAVFSPSVVQGYTDTFLKSNYDWLNGKTSQPQFRIDLTASKQKLADRIAQAVKTRVAGLKPCSAAQLAQLQSSLNTDPLSVPCVLPGISADTASQQVKKQIAESSDFLSTPVVTASSLNPNDGNQGRPYYQKLSKLPWIYRLNQKLPLILGVLALVCALGIIFISPSRRRGWRRLGEVLGLAGAILVIYKFAADNIFDRFQKSLFNHSNIDQLQKSLTSFLHLVESQLVKIDFWFGLAYLLLAVIILGSIWFSRGRTGKPKTAAVPPPSQSSTPPQDTKPPLPPLKRPSAPPPAKRPRLIQ